MLDSEEEAVAVDIANLIKEEIEELAVEAVAVELVALLVMVVQVVALEGDLDLVVETLVDLVLKPLVVEEVVVEIMKTKQ